MFCSLYVRDQTSHPYKTSCKIIALYILIFCGFWWREGIQKDFKLHGSKHSPNLVCSKFISEDSNWYRPNISLGTERC
jgi:hypothetical protein